MKDSQYICHKQTKKQSSISSWSLSSVALQLHQCFLVYSMSWAIPEDNFDQKMTTSHITAPSNDEFTTLYRVCK